MVKVNILDANRTELTPREKEIIELLIRGASPLEKQFMLELLKDEKAHGRF